jgi:NAD-dependent DNA ligase
MVAIETVATDAKTTAMVEKYEYFKKKGIEYLEKLNETELSDMIDELNHYYYNNNPLLTDLQFDIIKEYVQTKYANNATVLKIGAPAGYEKNERKKVELPYEMASMNKIKPDTNSLEIWKSKYNGSYTISCKLDGVSGMYSTENKTQRLYTRGDGIIGQDITHIIPHLNLPICENTVVRGEFILSKPVFKEKYEKFFANSRNLVSGIINSKTLDDKIKDLHFVVYEVVKPALKPSEQMEFLKNQNFEVVLYKSQENVTNEMLSDILLEWRNEYNYEIDGIVVSDDKIHQRTKGNPEHSFAFKMVLTEQLAEAKVVDVIWTPSKDGYLKPRIRIEPVSLCGVTIEYATGFNGKFIEDNKIGVGSVVQIVRSGDVIPHIRSVTVPAENPKMPDVPYIWTDTRVDIILENVEDNITVREKNITAFFTFLNVDGLAAGNVKKIMKRGYDTIPKILKMSKSDYENIDGFQSKLSAKIFEGIQKSVSSANLIDIMGASNLFGRGLGVKKIAIIMATFPNILTDCETEQTKKTKLLTITGIGQENANAFVGNINHFMGFLKECGLEEKLKCPPPPPCNQENTGTLLKNVCMTKVRDAEIIEFFEKSGTTLENTIKKNTCVLIVKNHEDISNKTKFAKENKIPIMTTCEFKEKYMSNKI